MNLTPDVVVPADRRDVTLREAFAGELSVRERAAIARKTDSEPPHAPPCPWCPGWIPDPVFGGESHGLCPTCKARLHAELDAVEASR